MEIHKCGHCLFYEKINEEEGKCRKNPPQTLAMPQGQSRLIGQSNVMGLKIISFWPQVRATEDFCGDYQSND